MAPLKFPFMATGLYSLPAATRGVGDSLGSVLAKKSWQNQYEKVRQSESNEWPNRTFRFAKLSEPLDKCLWCVKYTFPPPTTLPAQLSLSAFCLLYLRHFSHDAESLTHTHACILTVICIERDT